MNVVPSIKKEYLQYSTCQIIIDITIKNTLYMFKFLV